MANDQMALTLVHRPAFGREDFLVADSNRDAAAWIDAWPNWPIGGLALYGPAGAGKTHLAAAWANLSQAHWIEGETLQDFNFAMTHAARAYVVDRADQVPVPRALLHLLNAARESGAAVVLTAREAPARWPVALSDLASRLKALSAVPLQAPDDALLGAVLVKLFADRQVRVSEDLVNFLLSRLDRSVDVLRAAVERLDQAALAAGRRITIPFVREVLGDDEHAGHCGTDIPV